MKNVLFIALTAIPLILVSCGPTYHVYPEREVKRTVYVKPKPQPVQKETAENFEVVR